MQRRTHSKRPHLVLALDHINRWHTPQVATIPSKQSSFNLLNETLDTDKQKNLPISTLESNRMAAPINHLVRPRGLPIVVPIGLGVASMSPNFLKFYRTKTKDPLHHIERYIEALYELKKPP